jgi:hypothetical protein
MTSAAFPSMITARELARVAQQLSRGCTTPAEIRGSRSATVHKIEVRRVISPHSPLGRGVKWIVIGRDQWAIRKNNSRNATRMKKSTGTPRRRYDHCWSGVVGTGAADSR